MKIMLMYDLSMNDAESLRAYQKFHKNIIKRGYIMIQYSVYYKTINSHTKYPYEFKYLNKILPIRGHIRSFVITENQFYNMKILKGSKMINEDINNGKRKVVIDENLWEKY